MGTCSACILLFCKHVVDWLHLVLCIQIAKVFLDASFVVDGMLISLMLATKIMFYNKLTVYVKAFERILRLVPILIVYVGQLRVVLVSVRCNTLFRVLHQMLVIVITFIVSLFECTVFGAASDPALVWISFPLKLREILNLVPPFCGHNLFRNTNV